MEFFVTDSFIGQFLTPFQKPNEVDNCPMKESERKKLIWTIICPISNWTELPGALKWGLSMSIRELE